MKQKIAVVGAGVGGILTIAKLLDNPIRDPSDIVWIDPFFNVGRIGDKYRTVESNDEVWEWCNVLNKYKCLNKYAHTLDKYRQNDNENLSVIADVLMEITTEFRNLITCIQDVVTNMIFNDNIWKLDFQTKDNISVDCIILSTGSQPKNNADNVINGKTIIPLDQALDINILKTLVHPEDCIVVVGSGQSAILLLKHLNEMNVKSITNVYRHSLQQTIASLRGGTKRWALTHLTACGGNSPKENIERIHESDINNISCNKLIYATGYERNNLPSSVPTLDLDNPDGILGPSIYGIGIAFPDIDIVDGHVIKRVGLASFSRTLDRRIPLWKL